MLTQHYKLKATVEHITNAIPGCFVFGSDESEEIVGFVDFVSDSHIAIMLFKPTEIEDDMNAISISESCDFTTRLDEILEDNPYMLERWTDSLQD